MMWGTEEFEESEQDRPEFVGVNMASPVDGSQFVYFPEYVLKLDLVCVDIDHLS